MVAKADGAGCVRSIGLPHGYSRETSKNKEAWCRLGLGRSIFRSELASAEQMALGTYDRLVELAGCTL